VFVFERVLDLSKRAHISAQFDRSKRRSLFCEEN
jgi:hypothetical protein